MPSLYELTEQFRNVLEACLDDSDCEGEIGPEMAAALASIESQFNAKVDGCVRVLQSLRADEFACRQEAARLEQRARALGKRVDWLREYVMQQMNAVGKQAVKTPLFSVSVCDGQESVKIEPDANIPAKFIKPQPVQYDKTAIKQALKVGTEVPGCRLERTPYLLVK